MDSSGRVLLITGPAGSGKSTLAQLVATKLGWKYIEEDSYWVKNGWNHGLRTVEQEHEVQKQVFADLQSSFRAGKNIVLEFILYKNPPNPLTAYIAMLEASKIPYQVIALKPSVNEIMKRMQSRGRSNDLADLELLKKNAEKQVHCLEADYLQPGWVIDTSNISAEEIIKKYRSRII